MNFSHYLDYKETGVTWLGDVPAHWKIMTFQRCVYVAEGQVNPEESPYRSMLLIAPNHVESGTGRLLSPETAEEQAAESGKYLCRAGDVIYSKIRPALRKVCLAPEDCLCSADMYPLRGDLSLLFNQFLMWFMLSEPFSALAVLESERVAMPKINRESLKEVWLAIPPIDEQTAIVAFLDSETGKIDALIAEQEKLLTLLAEKRQATISRAVTRGLNPDALMKDSGLAWLGEVPAHWELGAFKRWFSTNSGGTPDTSRQEDFYVEEGGYPWIRTTDLGNARLERHAIEITDAAIQATACTMLPINSVLVAMYGGDGTIGKNALLAIEACINQAVCALLPNEHFDSRFTWRYVQFFRPHWMIGAESSRKDPNISQALIRNAPVLRPPMDEQRAIADFVDTETAKLDALRAEAEHAIELLKERRSALISAAVTGKIDAREQPSALEAAA